MDSETILFPPPATGNTIAATQLRPLRTYPWQASLGSVLARYTMGFELECQVMRDQLMARAIQLHVPADWTGRYNCDCRNGILAAWDSTIRAGSNGLEAREIKTQVLREADAPLASRILHLFDYLGSTGNLTSAGQTGSFHLHLRPARGWRDEDINVMLRTWRDIAQPLMGRAAGRSRTDPAVGGRWAAPVGDTLRWCRGEKYQQVSVRQMTRGRGTVEFRIYHATWSAAELTSWIQACVAICDAVVAARTPQQRRTRATPNTNTTRFVSARHGHIPLLVASNFRAPPPGYPGRHLFDHSRVVCVGQQRVPYGARNILSMRHQLGQIVATPRSIQEIVAKVLHMEFARRSSAGTSTRAFAFSIQTLTHIVSLMRLRAGRVNRGGSPAVNWRGVERALLHLVDEGWPIMRLQSGGWIMLERNLCQQLIELAVPDNMLPPIPQSPAINLNSSRIYGDMGYPEIPILDIGSSEWFYELVADVLADGIPDSVLPAVAPAPQPTARPDLIVAIRTAIEQHIAAFRPRNRLQSLRDYQREHSPRICAQVGLTVPAWIAATTRRRRPRQAA